MSIEPRWITLFRQKLEEAGARQAEYLHAGGPEDYSKYRESVGHLTGLIEAERLLDEVLKDMTGGN